MAEKGKKTTVPKKKPTNNLLLQASMGTKQAQDTS